VVILHTVNRLCDQRFLPGETTARALAPDPDALGPAGPFVELAVHSSTTVAAFPVQVVPSDKVDMTSISPRAPDQVPLPTF